MVFGYPVSLGNIQKRGLCKSTPENSPPRPATLEIYPLEKNMEGKGKKRREEEQGRKRIEGRKGKNFGNDGGREEKRTF